MLILWILLVIYLACVVTSSVLLIVGRNYVYDVGQEIREKRLVYIAGTIVFLLASPYFIVDYILNIIKSRRKRIRGVKSND